MNSNLVAEVINLNIDTNGQYYDHLSSIARELIADDILSAFDHACDLIIDHDLDVEGDHPFMPIYEKLAELKEVVEQ